MLQIWLQLTSQSTEFNRENLEKIVNSPIYLRDKMTFSVNIGTIFQEQKEQKGFQSSLIHCRKFVI